MRQREHLRRCAGEPIPTTPNVTALGSRYLSVSAEPAGSAAPVALRLTSPTWTCLDKYLRPDGQLVDIPVSQLPADWGEVFVTGLEIAPSSDYVIVAECGSFQSPPGTDTTARWGDTVGFFNGTVWTPLDGFVDITDILAILEGFSHTAIAPQTERIDLDPCIPDGSIDIADALRAVDAFQGLSYPCPIPCP